MEEWTVRGGVTGGMDCSGGFGGEAGGMDSSGRFGGEAGGMDCNEGLVEWLVE